MSELFLKLVNMSLTASWLIVAVILLRPVLKKAPKWIFCLLWGIAALRLVLPISFESKVSLVPSAEVIPESSIVSTAPVIDTGIPQIDDAVNPILSETLAPAPGGSVNPLQVILEVCSWVWAAGVGILLLYGLISWLTLWRQVRIRLRLNGNVYLCDQTDTPFILGVFRPKIYIPSGLPEEQQAYIIAHEKAHLKRLDHWWKPIGFLLLAVYWFNPLVWAGYILLCRDIEKACDEKVVKDMDALARKGYSEALIASSSHRRMVLACPLAFGEVGVKERIKAVLHYKKPAFWILTAAIAACIITAACFLTNPWQNTQTIEAIQRATTAREILMEAVGSHTWLDEMPPYMLGRYIGKDFKLYIRLNESGKDQEAALTEALGEYADITVFEYTTLSKTDLASYAKEVEAALTDRGIDVHSTRISKRSGNIIVAITNEIELSKAESASAELMKYSYGIEVQVRSSESTNLSRDYSDPDYARSIRASERLMSYFYHHDYITDYPDYYAGCYIGADNLCHVVINMAVKDARESMEKALGSYADDVVYEYSRHAWNDLQAHSTALMLRLDELGINITAGGVSEEKGIVTISVLEEDVHLAEALIDQWAPYPFGHTDIDVEFERGNYIVLE